MYPIPPHEIVYMDAKRQANGEVQRRMMWSENGEPHRAILPEQNARDMGLDIPAGTILCQPWAVLESLIEIAMFESLGV